LIELEGNVSPAFHDKENFLFFFSDCLWFGIHVLLWTRVSKSLREVQELQADNGSGMNE
jgi:hypothetical protein